MLSAQLLKRKEKLKNAMIPAAVAFIQTATRFESESAEPELKREVDPRFKPFISEGFVSLTEEEKDKVPVRIVRDTAAYHSFMLNDVLPLSAPTACNSDLLVWGIKMSVLQAPLHMVHLHSPLVTGCVKVAMIPRFPISGVSFIRGIIWSEETT